MREHQPILVGPLLGVSKKVTLLLHHQRRNARGTRVKSRAAFFFSLQRGPAAGEATSLHMAEEQPNLAETKAKEEGGGDHINLKVKSQVRE